MAGNIAKSFEFEPQTLLCGVLQRMIIGLELLRKNMFCLMNPQVKISQPKVKKTLRGKKIIMGGEKKVLDCHQGIG